MSEIQLPSTNCAIGAYRLFARVGLQSGRAYVLCDDDAPPFHDPSIANGGASAANLRIDIDTRKTPRKVMVFSNCAGRWIPDDALAPTATLDIGADFDVERFARATVSLRGEGASLDRFSVSAHYEVTVIILR